MSSDWTKEGLCAQVDPELFFENGSQHLAKRVCAKCPVIAECLTTALGDEMEYGVWGGTTANERALMRRRARSWRSEAWAARTECSNGHPLTGENVQETPTGGRCRTCRRDRDAEAYERKLLKLRDRRAGNRELGLLA